MLGPLLPLSLVRGAAIDLRLGKTRRGPPGTAIKEDGFLSLTLMAEFLLVRTDPVMQQGGRRRPETSAPESVPQTSPEPPKPVLGGAESENPTRSSSGDGVRSVENPERPR